MATVDRLSATRLRHALDNPHPETAELAEQGFEEWTRGLPDEDTESLVDSHAGNPVRWVVGEGWVEGRLKLGCEQHAVRPCVVVSHPDVIGGQRFSLVC